MLYSVVLVSALEHESSLSTPISPPSGASLPPPYRSSPYWSSQSAELSSLCYIAVSHKLCILHIVMYTHTHTHIYIYTTL